MHNLQQLLIWQKAIALVIDVYRVTSKFPSEEKFGLTNQARRCAVSIPSNIAEGAGRNSEKDFLHFLSIANGSSYELQTQLIIANELHFLSQEELDNLLIHLSEIQKMNHGFQEKLRSKI